MDVNANFALGLTDIKDSDAEKLSGGSGHILIVINKDGSKTFERRPNFLPSGDLPITENTAAIRLRNNRDKISGFIYEFSDDGGATFTSVLSGADYEPGQALTIYKAGQQAERSDIAEGSATFTPNHVRYQA